MAHRANATQREVTEAVRRALLERPGQTLRALRSEVGRQVGRRNGVVAEVIAGLITRGLVRNDGSGGRASLIWSGVACPSVPQRAPGVPAPPMHEVELRCMAPHPERRRDPQRFGNRLCGAFIGPAFVALDLDAVNRNVVGSVDDVRAGLIPAKCPKCRMVTEYEIVSPSDADASPYA